MSERKSILFLHGFTNTGASWDPVIGALGVRYRALAPDLRGHGRSSELEPVDLTAVLGDLRAIAPPDAFTVCGYSQGGRVALHLALAMRQRIARLVLIGASPGLADPVERAKRRVADEALAVEIERLSVAEFAERWAQTPVLAGLPAPAAAAARADRLRNTPDGLARALRGLGTGQLPPLWDRLGELTLPVTLIVGERDEKFRRISEAMARKLPSAAVEVVPNAGHAVHLEQPDAVASVLAVPVQ